MRNINQLRNTAKTRREQKKPPVITGGETQIDLALDAAANRGNFSAEIPGRMPPGLAKQYEDEGYKIVEVLSGTKIYFNEETPPAPEASASLPPGLDKKS